LKKALTGPCELLYTSAFARRSVKQREEVYCQWWWAGPNENTPWSRARRFALRGGVVWVSACHPPI